MFRTKFGKGILTVLLVCVMVFQMMSPGIVALSAVSDRDTTTKYTESLGDNASTEYAGRVWTDKSVFTTGVTFDAFGGGEITVPINGDAGEEFLITYSALATAEAVSSQTDAPVDVVFVIDISGSMSNNDSEMDNGLSRIANTVAAVNDSMETLMQLNDYTRVAVVAFSSTAEVLLPLDRYTKLTSQGTTYDYLSLNETSAGGDVDMYVRAVNSDNRGINKTKDVSGGTNIQMGLYTGMKELVDEQSTTANVNGATIQRTPAVILLSDGAPTYSSDSDNWWAPDNNDDDGPGSSPYYGNGFKALMTGAYMKEAINTNYGVAGTANAVKLYTIGMGITGLNNYEEYGYGPNGGRKYYTGEQDLAYITLNPANHWTSDNDMAEAVVGAWTSYTNQTANGSATISVQVSSNSNYQVSHPRSPLKDLYTSTDKDALQTLVDDYYDADNASAVTTVFEQIVASIASAPQIPTEIKGDDPLTDGYITYTDPIGRYMEVKDVKSIIYAGTNFTQKTTSVSGNTTTYTFSGEVHSPVYGDQNIRNIIIELTKDNSGNETLVVKIPASVIPLRVNEVELNRDGTVKSHTNNGSFPARVIYSVGLQDGIKQVSDDGHVYVDITKLDEAYVNGNINADGSVNFYSNKFTNTFSVNNSTAGDATVEFEPAHNNPFYYILKDMPIYKDRAFTSQVTEGEGLKQDQIYYYKEEYYHGTSVEVKAIARTGAQLTATAIVTGDDGNLYRAAGSPRLNRILEFEGTKIENATGTAEDFYAPKFVHAPDSNDPFEGKFVIHLGNNGVMSLSAGGNLRISKDVAAAAGLTAPGKTFTFTLDLNGDEIESGSYTYIVTDATGTELSRGTVSKNSPTIRLADGQTATVYALPPHTTYTITETAVNGFAQEAQGATGTIHAGITNDALFTNTYSVTSVTSANITGKKFLQGVVSWPANYRFTFFLNPYNDGPLPVGYDAQQGVSVGVADANGLEAAFDFGAIEFTAPGTYRYTVVEEESENDSYLPGMTYSRALYRLEYVVVDDGEGALSIQSSNIQRLYTDTAEQLFSYDANNNIVMNPGEEAQDAITFTNSYTAGSVTRVPTALKGYTDHSGTKPLVSGMFQFQLKAVGYTLAGGTKQTDITKVPMPEESRNGICVTSNEGHNITFPAVTFTQALLTDNNTSAITYHYEMSEVVPQEQDKVPGMTYDNSVYPIDVIVQLDPNGTQLQVSAIYPNGQRIVTFENSYAHKPVTGVINGTKILNGRNMLANEAFTFTLVGANAATNNAVRDGVVVVPTSEVSVSGGMAGQKLGFSFANIQFNRTGTYTFLVSETAGTAPAVTYDDTKIYVTVEVKDTNGDAQLEVVSTTYSNGLASADFVNTYTYQFNDTPISLSGTKNLTGKSLLEGEFYFNVESRYNGTPVGTPVLVTHTKDETATNGVYSGSITILEDVTYTEPGTYTYLITEQIPDDAHKVGGTTYDDTQFMYTVVVVDNNEGSLVVDSTKLERNDGTGWVSAESVVFDNIYIPEPTTTQLPLIKKVVSGDRNKTLEVNEFEFDVAVTYANPADGVSLPGVTRIGNLANGDIVFGPLTFTKAGQYRISVTEVVPADAQKVPGISYSTQRIDAVYHVVDNRDGTLTVILDQFIGGDTIINSYEPKPATYEPVAWKTFKGADALLDFSFELSDNGTVLQTKNNDTTGKVTFDELTFTQPGEYIYKITEKVNLAWGFIRWDTNEYTLRIVVSDTGLGQLEVDDVFISSTKGRNDLTFVNVHEDIITEKDVFLGDDLTESVDNKIVERGDILTYEISYTNHDSVPVDVTITDTIPANTTYVKNSADATGGTENGGVVTWQLRQVAAGRTEKVRFQVQVATDAGEVTNTAKVVEGNNEYTTNEVKNPVEKDIVVKSAYYGNTTATVDNKKVNAGDVLTYKITYQNNDDFAAEVTITDTIPANTTYVQNSADATGGKEDNGVITWKVTVPGGSEVTVSFQVKVAVANVSVINKAVATEGSNSYTTNEVTSTVKEDAVVKDVFLGNATTSIDGEKVKVGDVLTYKITYKNNDDFDASVTITDTIPANTTYVKDSAVATGGTESGGKITWNLTVSAGAEVTVSFQVTANVPDAFIDNQAVAQAGNNRIESNIVTNHTFEEVGGKDVALKEEPAVSIDGKAVQIGQILSYTIRYTNTTNAAVDVTITDTIPAHTALVDAEDGKEENGVITWLLEDIQPREEVVVSFQVKVVDAGITIKNQAKIFDGSNKVTNLVENSVPGKTADKQVASVGETLTYTVTYTNTTGAAADVVITDTLDEALIYVENTAGKGVFDKGVITWTLEDVPAGETVKVSFQAKIALDAKDPIKNTVKITENEINVITTNETQTQVKQPALTVLKQQAVGTNKADTAKLSVTSADVITYTITVTNTGEGDAFGVTVSDKIPEGLTCVDGSVSHAGKVENGVVTWMIDKLAAGQSAVLTFKVTVPVVEEHTTWTNVATAVFTNDSDNKPVDSNKVEVDQKTVESPKTGDDFNMSLTIVLMAASAVGMVVLLLMKKREQYLNN